MTKVKQLEGEPKRCPKCGEVYPLTKEFWYKRGDSDHYRSHCKACMNKDGREWKHENADRHKASTRIWQQNNRDRVREAAKRLTTENGD